MIPLTIEEQVYILRGQLQFIEDKLHAINTALVKRLEKLEAHNRVDTYCNCEWCKKHVF